ncbi:MAG: MerR family transcriptional regulator, partial [Thermocrispum sp.]
MPVQPMTIGQLAAAAGVTRKAIRVWLDKGLLVACDHTPAGYRLFGPDAVRRAQFIRRARGLGL